ncbi:MAG: ABC-type branched-chain amino acid transport system permease component, partial [Thermoleophilia bacterium]|nr:ABC-type branched-chain amino acid transport system permease component [Thermoleophilia bacterium]
APSMGGAAVDNSMGLGWGTWGPLNLSPWYYLALLLCGICFYVARTMQWSKLGRAWMAIREDETAASAMGIHCVNAKLWAYGIGASLGGLAGVYHGARIGSIFPSSFMFYISISVLCMVIVGGMGNVWGAVVGAFVIEGLNFWLLPSLTKWGNAIGLGIDFSSWNMLIFGVLLVVMMLYRPQGFVPSRSRKLVFADDDGVQGGELDSDEGGFPGGLHGPDGDQGHGMHVPLEVGAALPGHATSAAHAPTAPQPQTASTDIPASADQPASTDVPASADTPAPRPASLPRFGRFAPESNPFGRGLEPGGAPA